MRYASCLAKPDQAPVRRRPGNVERLGYRRFVSVGWDVGDVREIGADRARLKEVLLDRYPNAKEGAIPVWAGVLYRFAFEMQPGDLVISPNKADRTLNFGRVAGDYYFEAGAEIHGHRRPVKWVHTDVPRAQFSQNARYEIGSAPARERNCWRSISLNPADSSSDSDQWSSGRFSSTVAGSCLRDGSADHAPPAPATT